MEIVEFFTLHLIEYAAFSNKMYLEIKIWKMPWANDGSHRGERVKRKYAEITKSNRSAEWEAWVFKHNGSLHYSFLVFFLTKQLLFFVR